MAKARVAADDAPAADAPRARASASCGCGLASAIVVGVLGVAIGLFGREVLRPASPWQPADVAAAASAAASARDGQVGALGHLLDFFPEGVVRDALAEYAQNLPSLPSREPAPAGGLGLPGLRAAAHGVSAKHPILMVPGFVTSGLELWKGHECAGAQFRRRLWGTLDMLSLLTTAKDCWLRHMDLDGVTGADPPGVRVRAAQSFDAADYFAGSFWVWAPVLESLAHIGYTSSELHFAAYDWRLPFAVLETRDRLFSQIRAWVESAVRSRREKVVVVAHSMGCNVWTYFLKWISHPHPDGGGARASWIEEHIETIALIGAPQLGASCALCGISAGDSASFTLVPGVLGMTLNAVVSPATRRRVMRAFGAAQSLVPMGGNAVWGDARGAPDDDDAAASGGAVDGEGGAALGLSLGAWLGQRDAADADAAFRPYATVEDAVAAMRHDALRSQDERWADRGKPFAVWETQREWNNPLVTPLPHAPSLKIACLYGVGIPTERAYIVSEALARAQPAEDGLRAGDAVPWLIDRAASNGTALVRGVRSSDGDGTVNLVSLGYTCYSAWRKRRDLNPAGAHIVQREYADEKQGIASLRGGPGTAQHVDILGNHALLDDLLMIAAGRTLELDDQIVSAIPRIADAIDPRLAAADASSL